jgi:hypothetical protein
MRNLRDAETLETQIAEGTSTAVRMAATAGILATAGTPESSKNNSSIRDARKAETKTTAEALGMRPKQRQSQQQQQTQQEHLA